MVKRSIPEQAQTAHAPGLSKDSKGINKVKEETGDKSKKQGSLNKWMSLIPDSMRSATSREKKTDQKINKKSASDQNGSMFKLSNRKDSQTITLTFGECAVHHDRMAKIGVTGALGFSTADLKAAQDMIKKAHPNVKTELVDLHDYLPENYEYKDI